MKILVASGSFKDVFSPYDVVDMLSEVFEDCGHEVIKCPFCDGGEYTYEVLSMILDSPKEISVEETINAYGKKDKSHYLIDKNKIAHIVSSEILRLYPDEDIYKNPLKLTDYGLGQLIKDAIDRNIQDIILYLGGTSTVDFGMGMLQALGGKLYDEKEILLEVPVTPEFLQKINWIEINKSRFKNINLKVVVDGDAKADEMEGITRLKVGKIYQSKVEDIVNQIKIVSQAVIHTTGYGSRHQFSGAAGGLFYGIDSSFKADYTLGGDYFINLLGLKNKMAECDYVVTGEGRYDNTACGKAPVSIASLAASLGKSVIMVCGQIDKNNLDSYESGIIKDSAKAKQLGIDTIITCQKYYDDHPVCGSYKEQIEYYKQITPRVLKKLIKEMKL